MGKCTNSCSTLSGGINALSAVIFEDFLLPIQLFKKTKNAFWVRVIGL